MYKRIVVVLSNSPILTWGSVLIAALLLAYSLLSLWDVLEVKRLGVDDLLIKISKIESIESADISDWEERTAKLEDKHGVIFKQFLTTSSIGLVKVDIRDWLEQLTSELGLNTRVVLGVSELQASVHFPHWIVSATLTGQGKPEAVLPLIRKIEESEHFSPLVQVSLSSHSYQLLIDKVVLQELKEQQ